jgi:Zn-dependent peptidase ImmA (M78 family)
MATPRVLAQLANEKAAEIRDLASLDFRSPINVYDLCDAMRVQVRFVDIASMEGLLYIGRGRTTIALSALRPPSRKVYTCAHELGHHVFGHGATIDQTTDRIGNGAFEPNEFLADAFAGYLLMPQRAVTRAFVTRGWTHLAPTPDQVFVVGCSFGVGYETLVTHMTHGLRFLSRAQATQLRRSTLPAIRSSILGYPSKSPLVVADRQYSMDTLDVEQGTLLLLPGRATPESSTLQLEAIMPTGALFRATRPGLSQVRVPNSDWAVNVRVSRFQYVGLSQFRHLEEADDMDDEASLATDSVELRRDETKVEV